ATTAAATLTVLSKPVVTVNPRDLSAPVGQTVKFLADAGGLPLPTAQWQVSTDGGQNFGNVAGATSPALTVTVGTANNGNQYRAVFTNVAGSATTTAATLT